MNQIFSWTIGWSSPLPRHLLFPNDGSSQVDQSSHLWKTVPRREGDRKGLRARVETRDFQLSGRDRGCENHPKNRNIWKKNPTWPRIMGIFILRLYEIGMEAHESQLLSGTVGTSLELMRSFLNLVEKSTWKSWYSAGPFLWPQSIPAPEPLSIHLLDEEHLTRCPSGCHVAADSLSLEFLMDVYPLVNQHDELENHHF